MTDRKYDTMKLALDCKRAINTLRAHRKSADKEHAERAKKIQAVEDAICGWYQRGDLELPGFEGATLPPETVELIYNPLRGL